MAFRINHLHLKTPDPKKTADFYVQYTGAKVVKENTRPDGTKNFRLDLHGVELNVTEFLTEQKLSQFHGLEHVAIDTNEFDGEVGKIKAAGIKILEERVLPDGRRVCFFEGPGRRAAGVSGVETIDHEEVGVLEWWFLKTHHSNSPLLHHSNSYLSRSTFSSGPFSRNGSGQPMYCLKSGRALTRSWITFSMPLSGT